MQAQAASGMSAAEFEALPGDPQWCVDTLSKAHYFAWYTMRNQIEGVANEAQMRKIDADMARNKFSKRGRHGSRR